MMGPPEVYFVPPPPNYYGPVVYGLPHYDGPVAYGPPDPPSSYRPRNYGPPPAPDRTGNRAYPGPKAPPAGDQERRPAPTRSATAKTGPAVATPVKQDPSAKFKAAQAKAKRIGVEQLIQKDIEV